MAGLHHDALKTGCPILGPSGQIEDVKIENIEAMVEYAKECG
jgi:hypothetical protein